MCNKNMLVFSISIMPVIIGKNVVWLSVPFAETFTSIISIIMIYKHKTK